jgi:hypothetical protein
VAGRIRSTEKESRDLPACSIMPQPTTLPKKRSYALWTGFRYSDCYRDAIKSTVAVSFFAQI